MAQVIEITLTEEQRQELEAIVARPSEGAGLVRRARVILLSARGVSGREIALRLDLTPEHVSVIRARFRDEGVSGLHGRPKSGRTDHAVAPATVEKIVQLAMSPPPAGRSR
jgi:CRP-like cAMP-binding protein